MKNATVWIITLAVLLLFVLAGLLVPGWVGLVRGLWWLIAAVFWVLGAGAALLIFFWLRPRVVAAPAGEDEIDVLIAAARTRLATARGRNAAAFRNMPVMLVTGPAGSAKTTIVTRSGLDPELLAGEVVRGDAVVPTGAVNVWYAQNNLVVEVGAKVSGDAGRWKRMVRHIQPNRLAAAFTRKRQAPRIAIVCFGCDGLLRPGASEAVPAAAQRLRARLAEVSQQIGIRLPVYVLFTKADRLPYWDEYVRNFTRDEARDVLGVTLTVPAAGAVGQYAERESRRIAEAFATLFRGLAARRLEVLPRETQDAARSGAYEFPREFRKTGDLATQFLLDLCRPSQLGVSPFLRGFYFTGVRAVYVHDVGAAAPSPAVSTGGAMAMDATGVFDPRALQQQAMARQAAPVTGSRKVPEWVFLERVFRDVVLRDDVARGVTAGGTRVDLFRRAGLAAAAALFLVVSVGMSVSFWKNRSLRTRAESALTQAGNVPALALSSPLEALQRLDALRTSVREVARMEHEGRPWSHRWGLYTGDALYDTLRPVYFAMLRPLIWDDTQRNLLGFLHGLPERPDTTSDYDVTSKALKAHLITTTHPQYASGDSLPPLLMPYWRRSVAADSAMIELANAQFAFYGEELPYGNPYQDPADAEAISRTQAFLCAFRDESLFYNLMLASASDAEVAFQDPNNVLTTSYRFPNAFTKDGWARVQEQLSNLGALFNREPWVVSCPALGGDLAALADRLRQRYVEDYRRHWRDLIANARIAAFGGNLQSAATQLGVLAHPANSPLLRLVAQASANTVVDSTRVDSSFAALHTFVTPGDLTRYSGANEGYMRQLGAMLAAIQAALSASAGGPPETGAVQQANIALRNEINMLVQGFPARGEAGQVAGSLRDLLAAPALNMDRLIAGAPVQALNAEGTSLCTAFRPLQRAFPFNGQASGPDAQINDVTTALKMGTGELWNFYNKSGELSPRGDDYQQRQGSRLTPEFVRFFNAAARLSRYLYDAQGNGPRFRFELRPSLSNEINQVTIVIDGQNALFTMEQRSFRAFDWDGQTAASAEIRALVRGQAVQIGPESGPWAVFRLLNRATWQPDRPGTFNLRFPLAGSPSELNIQLSYVGASGIFSASTLRLACPSPIAR